MNRTHALLAATFALSATCLSALAQDAESAAKPATTHTGRVPDARPIKTFYLRYATELNDSNEMLTALRNMIEPSDKIFLTASRNAITVRAEATEFPLVQQIIDSLDRPKQSFRLTYTLTEMDGGKRVGTQHISLIAANGQRVTMKQGSKIPVQTGSYNSAGASSQMQMTYLDVGLNFDATFTGNSDGGELKTKVEQSGLAEEKSGVGPQDPVVRQSVLEGVSLLTPGKPVILGSIDIPGSTRHLDIEVMEELIK